jgi:CRISPR-associated protein Csh1
VIEAIRTIGEVALQKDLHVVKALVHDEDLPSDKKKYLVYLDIDLESLVLNLEIKDVDYEVLNDVLWVGNASGSNDPQDRLTTDHIEYLASQTIPNLYNALHDWKPESSLCNTLKRLKETLFLDLGPKEEVLGGLKDQQYKRYRWVWDISRLGIAGLGGDDATGEIKEICEEQGVDPFTKPFLRVYAQKKGKAKEMARLVGEEVENWICKNLGVKKDDVMLYTLKVNGELLAAHPDYSSYLENNLIDETFDGTSDGVCHICGALGKVTGNTTRFKLLKFYITDKPGFASGLSDEGFYRNYALCQKCYKELLAGERFVENNLKTKLGYNNVYVIPLFHSPAVQPAPKTLERWARYLTTRLGAMHTLESWRKFQKNLEEYKEFEDDKPYFILNLLFATKKQGAVKVDKLIQDIPPSRLDQLDKARNSVWDKAKRHFGDYTDWDLRLKRIFYLLPLHKQERTVQTDPFLDFLDKLLTGAMFSYKELIPQFLETATIYYFKNGNYAQKIPDQSDVVDQALVKSLVQSQLVLLYLEELNQLYGPEGGELMEDETRNKGIHEYVRELNLEKRQVGLFLLGYLIGQIGSTEPQRVSGKPILNKVDFRGMDQRKIMRLTNEVYEKLRQYKIAEYNEAIYAEAKMYLDSDPSKLYSPQENTYWVLSGYAYATWQAIRHGRAKPSEEEEKEVV